MPNLAHSLAMHGEGTVSIFHQQSWNLPAGKSLSDLLPTSTINPPRSEDIPPDMYDSSLERIFSEHSTALTATYIVNACRYKTSLSTGQSRQLHVSREVMGQLQRETHLQMTHGAPSFQSMPSPYSPVGFRATQVPMQHPHFSFQLDTYAVPERERG